jgi:signal transduction histidine kinase
MAGLALLLVAALALVEVGRLLRDARRARRLNRGMHELRRPLQSIAMSLAARKPDLAEVEACLRQARCALRELDATVNGGALVPIVRRARIREVTGALDLRWRFADVEVEAPGRDQEVEADVDRLGAALDNLVSNALRHGTGVVRVRAVADGERARFEVRDSGPQPAALDVARDPRHSHGLAIVSDAVTDHGGTLAPPDREAHGGTLAAITLPVARRSPTG